MAIQDRERSASKEQVNIRIPQHRRNVIDQAARLQGKTRTEFMVDASYRMAEEVLHNRTVFTLNPEEFDRFKDLLDNPPPPTEALRTLLNAPTPWDEE